MMCDNCGREHQLDTCHHCGYDRKKAGQGRRVEEGMLLFCNVCGCTYVWGGEFNPPCPHGKGEESRKKHYEETKLPKVQAKPPWAS